MYGCMYICMLLHMHTNIPDGPYLKYSPCKRLFTPTIYFNSLIVAVSLKDL